ncbi:MAG: triose-phosphate isomerase family protein [Candidatus Babeliaceae bacterium]|jgi:triosephosphate isomerase
MTKKIIIANWKANKPFDSALAWVSDHYNDLAALAQTHTLVLCPDFVTIAGLKKIAPNTVHIGAQDCSEHEIGPWTGQVPALSLAQAGCTLCIIGHTETQKLYPQSTELLIKKTYILWHNNIIPIICVSTHQQAQQLCQQLAQKKLEKQELIIAFEPKEAIGAQSLAPEKIKEVIYLIQEQAQLLLPQISCRILYGGGVHEKNISELAAIDTIDGFLVGSASLDFQKLKKIVLSLKK